MPAKLELDAKFLGDDELHPNELGMKVMAEAWYRTLAGKNAKQDIVDRMYKKDYDVDTIMREYIRFRREQ